MTMSCISSLLEKQIVLRANRLIRVLNVKCFRSIRWVLRFPTSCCSGGMCLSYAPHPSVQYLWIPNGSSNLFNSRNTSSLRRPKTYANTLPLRLSSACHNHLWLPLLPTKLHISSSSDSWISCSSSSSARSSSTSIFSGFRVSKSFWLTWLSFGLFF